MVTPEENANTLLKELVRRNCQAGDHIQNAARIAPKGPSLEVTERRWISQPTDFPVNRSNVCAVYEEVGLPAPRRSQHPACQLIDGPKLAHLGATQVGPAVGIAPISSGGHLLQARRMPPICLD